MKEHLSCLVCGSINLKKLIGYEKAHLCQCGKCSFIFSKRIPSSQELDNYYKDYGTNSYLSPLTIKRYNEILDQFEPFRKTNKILDVGCGIGYFLEEAKKRGWEVYGTELSEKSAEICALKNIHIKQGALNADHYKQDMFDIVTSFEVIEHINYPLIDLKNIHSIMRKGGLVYVTTPNFNSLLRVKLKSAYNVITYPEHLSYYTPKTLEKVFKRSGFQKLKIETTGISITRLRTSQGKSNQKIISAKSDDEKIRNQMDTKWYLKFLKTVINTSLTSLGRGDSLKGWFVKQ